MAIVTRTFRKPLFSRLTLVVPWALLIWFSKPLLSNALQNYLEHQRSSLGAGIIAVATVSPFYLYLLYLTKQRFEKLKVSGEGVDVQSLFIFRSHVPWSSVSEIVGHRPSGEQGSGSLLSSLIPGAVFARSIQHALTYDALKEHIKERGNASIERIDLMTQLGKSLLSLEGYSEEAYQVVLKSMAQSVGNDD